MGRKVEADGEGLESARIAMGAGGGDKRGAANASMDSRALAYVSTKRSFFCPALARPPESGVGNCRR